MRNSNEQVDHYLTTEGDLQDYSSTRNHRTFGYLMLNVAEEKVCDAYSVTISELDPEYLVSGEEKDFLEDKVMEQIKSTCITSFKHSNRDRMTAAKVRASSHCASK